MLVKWKRGSGLRHARLLSVAGLGAVFVWAVASPSNAPAGAGSPSAANATLTIVASSLPTASATAALASQVDALIKQGNTRAAVEAVDALLESVDKLQTSSFGSTGAVRDYPDALCERAVALLDHPDPVVQAGAEWMLSLRVKKLDGGTRDIAEMLLASTGPPAWYRRWRARPVDRALADDYSRQLIHLGRHRTVDAVADEIENAYRRLKRMASDPESRPASEQMRRLDHAIAAARDAAASGDLERAHVAYVDVRLAGRALIVAARPEFPAEGVIFFTNPRLPGGAWNVNVPVTGRTNTPFGNIYLKRGADPADPADPLLDPKFLGDGAVRGLDLDWGADRIVFSYWHKPIDGSKPYGWSVRGNARLYEMDLQTRAVRSLTDKPGNNDIEPCYLPDGGVVFASDRSSFGNQCAGPFLQDKRCTSLYRLDPRRSPNPVALTNNKDFDRHPHVLNDGTVVFMHWEYQERGLYSSHNAWRCRPDGTNMDAFYKQHISRPFSIRDVQQAPDSDVCVATVQGHHDGHSGPVVLVRPSLGINSIEAMTLLTPGCSDIEGGLGPVARQVVPEGGVENRGGSYVNPFPVSDRAFLVGHDMTDEQVDYGLYYIDVWGNRELVHRDRDMSVFMPHPMRKRTRPPVVADTVDPNATYATAFVEDVYRDLPGVERGAVKYLRIAQRLMMPAPVDESDPAHDFNHLHWLPGDATAPHFGYWTWAPTRTIGLVRVEDDGSAYFRVPAGTPVYLQALDADYCEVRRMRTSFTLQRGEFRSCVGCHETRHETVGMRPSFPRATLERGPQTPEPPSWGDRRALDYRQDIQPIFDRSCVECHGQNKPAGGIDLTDREIGGFSQSYRSLFGLKPGDPTVVNELDWHLQLHPEARGDRITSGSQAKRAIVAMQQNKPEGMLVAIANRFDESGITQPYQFGSNRSRLIRVLLDDPAHGDARASIGHDDWLKLVTWIDQNAVYYSTVIDKSGWTSQKKLVRVPVYVPSPWVPTDTGPSFLNRYRADQPPLSEGPTP